MKPEKNEGIPTNSPLLTNEVHSLSPEKRRELALEYINRFAGKNVDDTVIRDAGINIKTTDPRHLVLARLEKGSLPLEEMSTRLNYCQYLIQAKRDDIIFPYTKLRLAATMGSSFAKRIGTSPEEEIRIVNNPFYPNNNENVVRKLDEKDKETNLGLFQLLNRVNSSADLGQRFIVPDVDTVAVLYFVHDKPAQNN